MDLIREACNVLKMVLQARAPYDTGNLALNSIRIVNNAVLIGGEIADYAIYTNEKWTKGKNPNEGWVERAIEEAKPLIQRIVSGRASIEDIRATQQKYKTIIAERKQTMTAELKEIRDIISGGKAE